MEQPTQAPGTPVTAAQPLGPKDETIDFNGVRLVVDASDNGSKPYKEAKWFEEWRSALFADIRRALNPKFVIDIGANYGMTVLLEHDRFPDAHIIAAEPNSKLWPYLEHNAKANGLANFSLFRGLVGDSQQRRSFGVLAVNSQDSRVVGPDNRWIEVDTEQTTLDDLASKIPATAAVYIKVDTQGYEQRVFKGAEGFLSRNRNWLLKTEFAPNWLRSQGTDPAQLLHYLVSRYAVAEAPARLRYREPLASLLAPRRQLRPGDIAGFLRHVENLNRKQLGWVDLFVFPRELAAAGPPRRGRLARAVAALMGN